MTQRSRVAQSGPVSPARPVRRRPASGKEGQAITSRRGSAAGNALRRPTRWRSIAVQKGQRSARQEPKFAERCPPDIICHPRFGGEHHSDVLLSDPTEEGDSLVQTQGNFIPVSEAPRV